MLMAQKNSTVFNGKEFVAEALTFALFDGKYANNMWIIDFDEILIFHENEELKNDTEFIQNQKNISGTIYQFHNWMGSK
jgi:hypothetical protein